MDAASRAATLRRNTASLSGASLVGAGCSRLRLREAAAATEIADLGMDAGEATAAKREGTSLGSGGGAGVRLRQESTLACPGQASTRTESRCVTVAVEPEAVQTVIRCLLAALVTTPKVAAW